MYSYQKKAIIHSKHNYFTEDIQIHICYYEYVKLISTIFLNL